MLVYQAAIMTKLHHITLFLLFVSHSLSLTISLPLTFGLSPRPPVPPPYTPEPVPEPTPSESLTPPSINPIDNSSNTSNTNTYDCFKTSPFAPARPLYNDCLSAIRVLPIDPTRGQFQYVQNPHLATPNLTPLTAISTGSPSDAYRLPRFETSGTCRVFIGLNNFVKHGETGSWAGVGLEAGQLNMHCVQYGSLKEFYGGKTTGGDHGKITVVLLYSGESVLGENGTEIASL